LRFSVSTRDFPSSLRSPACHPHHSGARRGQPVDHTNGPPRGGTKPPESRREARPLAYPGGWTGPSRSPSGTGHRAPGDAGLPEPTTPAPSAEIPLDGRRRRAVILHHNGLETCRKALDGAEENLRDRILGGSPQIPDDQAAAAPGSIRKHPLHLLPDVPQVGPGRCRSTSDTSGLAEQSSESTNRGYRRTPDILEHSSAPPGDHRDDLTGIIGPARQRPPEGARSPRGWACRSPSATSGHRWEYINGMSPEFRSDRCV
jgi:hypothetical protein